MNPSDLLLPSSPFEMSELVSLQRQNNKHVILTRNLMPNRPLTIPVCSVCSVQFHPIGMWVWIIPSALVAVTGTGADRVLRSWVWDWTSAGSLISNVTLSKFLMKTLALSQNGNNLIYLMGEWERLRGAVHVDFSKTPGACEAQPIVVTVTLQYLGTKCFLS